MRWLAFALLLLLAGCSSDSPKPAAMNDLGHGSAVPPIGAELQLVLLTQLESGKAHVNASVPFVVTRDVLAESGAIAIPKGSFALATVAASRGEGALSAAVLNQPARLSVKFIKVVLPSGREYPLSASPTAPDEPLTLTRKNTSPPGAARASMERHLSDQARRELLERLAAGFESGKLDLTSFDSADLEATFTAFDMPNTTKIIEERKLDETLGIIEKLRDARSVDVLAQGLSAGQLALALQAVGEIAQLGGEASNYLKGRFKGRNIRALPGMAVTAYVARE